jgi:hypothetical protein
METATAITTYLGSLKPEYSKMVSDIQPTSFGTRIKKFFTALFGGAIVGFIIAAICAGVSGAGSSARWPVFVGLGIVLIVLVMEVPAIIKSQQALCPYCGGPLGNKGSGHITRDDVEVQVECPRCFEWLMSSGGQIRAFKTEDIKEQKEFQSPLFQSGTWPNECIVCGGVVAKYGEAKNTKLNVAKLFIGRISVAWGSIKNVPYCALHDDAVKLKVDDPDVLLLFSDYTARRRYLAMNPMRLPSKVK